MTAVAGPLTLVATSALVKAVVVIVAELLAALTSFVLLVMALLTGKVWPKPTKLIVNDWVWPTASLAMVPKLTRPVAEL